MIYARSERLENTLLGTMSRQEEGHDPRLRAAWRTWLSALAVDADAAVAAALAYESLAPEGRDAWLDAIALDLDDMRIPVPAIALYAPLLAVEEDESRKARMGAALAARGQAITPASRQRGVRALCGRAPTGEHACALLSPLYLDSVTVLVCRYPPDRGLSSAHRDPMRHLTDVVGRRLPDAHRSAEDGSSAADGTSPAPPERGRNQRPRRGQDDGTSPAPPERGRNRRPRRGQDDGTRKESWACTLDGIWMVEAPLSDVVEELAHAIVADRRQGRAAPEIFGAYVHLFVPDLAPSEPWRDDEPDGDGSRPSSCDPRSG